MNKPKNGNMGIIKIIENIQDNSQCLMKDIKIDCTNDGKTARCHFIQKKGSLSQIADVNKSKREVMIFNIYHDNYYNHRTQKKEMQLCDIKKVHRFNLFCNKHDKDIFSKIENNFIFDKTNTEQLYLLAFRAFIFNFYESWIKNNKEVNKIDPHKNWANLKFNYSYQTNLETLNKFKRSYIENNFDIVESYVVELDKNIKFVSSMLFEPYMDLRGRLGGKVKRTFFLNIFPHEQKSYIVFSWLKEDSVYCQKYIDQIIKSIEENRIKQLEYYLTKCIILHDRNLTINPTFYNELCKSSKEEFYKMVSPRNERNLRGVFKFYLRLKLKTNLNLFD